METIRSDIEYPAWPAGKAPWALERGGSGLPPLEAMARSSSSTSSSTRSSVRSDSMLGGSRARIGRPPTDYKPQTDEEAEKMMSVGRKLLETAVRSDYSGLTRAEQIIILENLEQILERGRDK